ncbi:adenylyltransferase/cytidyltransferase family protein [Thalassospira lucentensis]|uniref:adenylyltransferase/cytidyltransferase family protein n=1 Tax=Thalassospira lucentensis TaxID=168935 RepID=UPI0003B64A41|nr:adenylyltransferase/cytidyltransferase family protein [Thalassospira lucentensis]RCK18816.1 glycerol-3-phosphate cytidylyltransferase [Thalassospira lucentensis MCCC 1A00383 = DSM 14000]
MKKVVTYGTFDLFHIGHLRLLERLRNYGDHLTVFVSTDEFNEVKGKKSLSKCADRAEVVAALRCVDEVYFETCWDQKVHDINRLDIDIFGMGDDWLGKFDFLLPHCQVIYLPRTEGVSSSYFKKKLSSV